MQYSKFLDLMRLFCGLVLMHSCLFLREALALSPCPSGGTVTGNLTLNDDISVSVGGGTSGKSCLYVNSGTNPIVIDCQGHSITALPANNGNVDNGLALYVLSRPNVTIRNCRSQQSVWYFLDGADYGRVENSTFSGINMTVSADYGVIKNNILGGLTIEGKAATIVGNQITGNGQHPLYLTNPNHYNGCPFQGTVPTGVSIPERLGYETYNHVIMNNIVFNMNPRNVDLSSTDPEGSTAMYIVCSGNNYVGSNVFATQDIGTAVFIRDSANTNKFEYNLIRNDLGIRSAFFWGDGGTDSAGTPPLTEPKDNTFLYNIFWGNSSRGFEARVSDGNNLFQYNLFRANASVGERLTTSRGLADRFLNNTFYNAFSTTAQNLANGVPSTAVFQNNFLTDLSSPEFTDPTLGAYPTSPSCTPAWSCTGWSTNCIFNNTKRLRACRDANNCRVMPVTEQACSGGGDIVAPEAPANLRLQ